MNMMVMLRKMLGMVMLKDHGSDEFIRASGNLHDHNKNYVIIIHERCYHNDNVEHTMKEILSKLEINEKLEFLKQG